MAVFANQHSQSVFFSLFPPPTFLTMPSVGVDVSDRSIKFVELTASKVGRVPERFGDVPLAEGGVVDGVIQNPDTLRAGLEGIKKKYGFQFVRVSLPEQQAYVFTTTVPFTRDGDQLDQMLEFKLEENVPLAPNEAIFGYDVLSTEESEEGEMDIAVTVYPKASARRYIEIFEQAGLTPLSLEIESQAIARSVIKYDEQATYLIVDFGETRSGLAIVSDELLSFTTTLEVPGRKLTEAIMAHGAVDSQEVARIKNEEGIQARGGTSVHESLMAVISKLTDEVARHYRYWESIAEKETHSDKRIKKVLLCGGNANLAGLPEYMAAALKLPVERANVWINSFSFEDSIPQIPFEHSLSYATAIGLALRDT